MSNTEGKPEGSNPPIVLEWDWDIEHADRKREREADAALHGSTPFEVDRRILKDVVLEHMKTPAARILFLSAGTFHKAYLITLTSGHQVVARVARRFMPRLKTESEIATLSFLREKTLFPVPEVHTYDSNPYNRLGGEYIIMSKAPGIPLYQVYHSLSYAKLVKLLENLAKLLIPLFGQRFPQIGSLYYGPGPKVAASAVAAAAVATPTPFNAATPTLTRLNTSSDTPRATHDFSAYSAFPFTPTLMPRVPCTPPTESRPASASATARASAQPQRQEEQQFHVGPIISWPFFGSHRGDLSPAEVPRGPFPSTSDYLTTCVTRELLALKRENLGAAAGHRLHLDPDEIVSSRHHRVLGVPGDESDESDEWGLEESEDEWEGPGDAMYTDYRRGQRGTFLVAHIQRREEEARRELGRWMHVMERLRDEWRAAGERAGVGWGVKGGGGGECGEGQEEFALDAHDLSLENIFVDPEDPSKITCVIDWESTTTRPLWASAHLPAFLQSSPFTAKLFREAVARLANASPPLPNGRAGENSKINNVAALAREWLHHERTGMRLRMAHRVVEWDGWEEGLVDSILGPEDVEGEWFHDHEQEENECEFDADDDDGDGDDEADVHVGIEAEGERDVEHEDGARGFLPDRGLLQSLSRRKEGSTGRVNGTLNGSSVNGNGSASKAAKAKLKPPSKGGTTTVGKPNLKRFAKNLEREREQMLDTTGDICGGRGGELGRRLEAWLTVSENVSPEEETFEERLPEDGQRQASDVAEIEAEAT